VFRKDKYYFGARLTRRAKQAADFARRILGARGMRPRNLVEEVLLLLLLEQMSPNTIVVSLNGTSCAVLVDVPVSGYRVASTANFNGASGLNVFAAFIGERR
jgi:hypothetical protein